MEENKCIDIKARPRPTVFASLVMVLLAAVGLWAGSLAAASIIPEPGIAQSGLMSGLYYLPFIIDPIVIYMLRRRACLEGMRLNPVPVLPTLSVIGLALMSVLAASELVYLWSLLLDAAGLSQSQATLALGDRQSLALNILLNAALPAICEELLFRGFVFSAWEGRGTRLAMWVSTLLFALLHGNLYGIPAYLLAGAVSAFLVFALDSLYAGMIYHTVYNAFILIVNQLAGAASGGETATAAAAPSAASMLLEAVLLLGAIGLVLRGLNARRRLEGIEPVARTREPLAPRERVMLAVVVTVLLGTIAIIQYLEGGA